MKLLYRSNTHFLDDEKAKFLAIALSQKIETKLTQKLTTEEFEEFETIILTANNRSRKRNLDDTAINIWSTSTEPGRYEMEKTDTSIKFEKFLNFLLSVNLKDQLTNTEKNNLITHLKEALENHIWLKDKITDLLERLE